MPYQCWQVHTNTPQVVIGIVEPWTPRLTARTLSYQTGFLLSAMNTHRNRISRSGDWVINKNNPKVAVEETGGRGIQVDIKSEECQQQTPDTYIHTCLGQVLHTDHYPIIDIGGDKNRMNKMTHYRGELSGVLGNQSGVIGDKSGSDDKGVTKIEQRWVRWR